MLHPTNKQPVGERLALLAEAHVHGLPVEWTGPVFQSAGREGVALQVRFTHAAGLVARPAPLPGFELAGSDRVFHAAIAQIGHDG